MSVPEATDLTIEREELPGGLVRLTFRYPDGDWGVATIPKAREAKLLQILKELEVNR